MVFNLPQDKFKTIINYLCLFLTWLLVVYELTQVSDSALLKLVFVFCAVALELIAAYSLGLGIAYWKNEVSWHKTKAIFLFIFYSCYVVIFAILAGIGFFMAELDTKTVIAQENTNIESVIQKQINQNDTTMTNLNKQLETESKTGYRTRSQAIMDQYNQIQNEQKELREQLTEVSKLQKNVPKNFTASLGKAFRCSENVFKILIFAMLIVALYIGQILTAWHVDIKEEKQSSVHIENKDELIQFTNALFEGTKNRLNGVDTIADKTGIPKDKCLFYRDLLAKLRVNGKNAINVDRGASTPNYPKDRILNLIEAM